MTTESYYFILSLILLEAVVFHLLIISYARLKGGLILGDSFQKNTKEYQWLMTYASKANFIISTLITFLLIVNFLYAVNKVKSLESAVAHDLLFFGTIGITVVCIIVAIIGSIQINNLLYFKYKR